jgi:recombination protein RecR
VNADPIARLVAELAKLPGIGEKSAQRLAFHILKAPRESALSLSTAIREVTERVHLCTARSRRWKAWGPTSCASRS